MAKTIIKFRFKKGVAFSLPDGGIFYPKLHATSKRSEHDKEGNFPLVVDSPYGPAPVQEYRFESDFREIELPEEEAEIPEHVEELGEDVRKAFLANFATKLAENHAANNVTRKALQHYANAGYIELISDSFLDKRKAKALAKEIAKEETKVATQKAAAKKPAPEPKVEPTE